ncbi:MAG: hypothetical protein J6W45_01135 [Bacteroidales bacterium]|nr:hypothetical protein [Bacteroidales bacterium]
MKPAQIKFPTNANTSSISINTQPQQSDNAVEQKKNEPVTITLSQDELEKQWRELAELKKLTNMEVFTAMNEKEVKFIDQENFEVVVNNNIYESNLKRYKTDILEALRFRTGIDELNFTIKVVPLYDESEAKLFTTKDKFEAMAKENPAFVTFRNSLFQDIDY